MNLAKSLKKIPFSVKLQAFKNLYFKNYFVVTASARFTTCVYKSLWFLFGEGLISPDQLTLIGVSISNYSYLSSSYKNEIVISSIFQ